MIFDLQKASLLKRISAALLDVILLGILVVGLAFFLSVFLGYDSHNAALQEAYRVYEEKYGVSFEMTSEAFENMTGEEEALYFKAYEALTADKEAMYHYNMVLNLSLVIASLSIFLGYILLECIVPALFGNGQTVGKKIFGIGVMRTDGVKVSAPLMFIRTVLGKFTIETMIPVLIIMMIFFYAIGRLGLWILAGILVVQTILLFASRYHALIHDVLAKTVVIDMASQMIFESEAELIAYKNKVHQEQVTKSIY